MKNRLKILIAPDKFKGSISSDNIGCILKEEISTALPNVKIELCPLADGGEGSVAILTNYLNLIKRECHAQDPLGRPIKSSYFTSNKTAYIELASASGLMLLDESERGPMVTSTYGTGLVIQHALNNGVENIYLFLGGSATNDGGMGIASALGYKFQDENGNDLGPQGSSLSTVHKILPPNESLKIKRLMLCCDVQNLPYGKEGAAQVYAKQKGASKEEIIELDKGLKNLCHRIKEYCGTDMSRMSGGGAAGGVSVCLSGLMDGEIISGMEMISKTAALESKIANSDLVITGEGRLDDQSLNGKVVSGVAELCRKLGKELWVVVGKNELDKTVCDKIGIRKLFSIIDYAKDDLDAIQNASKYLRKIGVAIVNEMGTN